MAPKLIVRDIALLERPVRFRLPFQFGAATIAAAPETFVQVEVEIEGKGRVRGASAELMVPKWFNKDAALSPEQTVGQLRCALKFARDLYIGHCAFDTAFGLHAACYAKLIEICGREGIPPLAAGFGAAEIDKAILDALLRGLDLDVFSGLTRNVVGLDARLTPDIDDAAIAAFLAARKPSSRILVRHTIGLSDSIEGLFSIVAETGIRYFKIKLAGDLAADCERLAHVVDALSALRIDYRLTLDANEQYASHATLAALVEVLLHDEAFEPVIQRLLYIEQPLPRELTWQVPLGDVAGSFAFIIDEADSGYDSFPRALELGYRGISSKSCKGVYKSLLNGARSARWNASGAARSFVTAEDLTCQAGIAVQQDSALAAFHGLIHAERNGHHYVDGFSAAPEAEARAFLAAHPDLYEESGGRVRLKIRGGAIATGSLAQPGFACGVDPALAGRRAANATATTLEEFGT